jgi:hypothetical protein
MWKIICILVSLYNLKIKSMAKKKKKEAWVVPTYNGIQFNSYLISSEGRLVSKVVSNRNKKEKPIFDNYRLVKSDKNYNHGYEMYHPYDSSGKRHYLLAHRLVFESFVCPITKGMVIDHIDADKRNNSLTNLQMITYSENLHKYHTVDKLKKKRK